MSHASHLRKIANERAIGLLKNVLYKLETGQANAVNSGFWQGGTSDRFNLSVEIKIADVPVLSEDLEES